MESLQDLIIPVDTSNQVMIIAVILGAFLVISWLVLRIRNQQKSAKKEPSKSLKGLVKSKA